MNSIKQIRSEYYDTKYWQNQASLGLYETKLGYLEQIENYFIDDDTEKGFSTILNKMFNSLDTLTHPAGDTNVRQQFISDAQSFMTYFNSWQQVLDRFRTVSMRKSNLPLKTSMRSAKRSVF